MEFGCPSLTLQGHTAVPGVRDTDEPEKKLIVQSEEQPAAHFCSQLFSLPLREAVGRLRNQKYRTHTFFCHLWLPEKMEHETTSIKFFVIFNNNKTFKRQGAKTALGKDRKHKLKKLPKS